LHDWALYLPRVRSSDLLGRRLELDFMQYPLPDEAAGDRCEKQSEEYRNVNGGKGRLTYGRATATNMELGRLSGKVGEPAICDAPGNNECGDSERYAAQTRSKQ
jgi:hypothetical protein